MILFLIIIFSIQRMDITVNLPLHRIVVLIFVANAHLFQLIFDDEIFQMLSIQNVFATIPNSILTKAYLLGETQEDN
jgi:hypothetical protein